MLSERAASNATRPEAPTQPPPSEHFLSLFEAIETDPNEPLNCHLDTLIQLGESFLPHLKSRKGLVGFNKLIPPGAATVYIGPRPRSWIEDAILEREGKPLVKMRIGRADLWGGSGVHIWIKLTTEHDSLEIHSVKDLFAKPTLTVIQAGRNNQRIELKRQRAFFRSSPKPRWEKVHQSLQNAELLK